MNVDERSTLSPEANGLPLLNPGDMTFDDFCAEYTAVMQAVAEKEKKGGLDPNDLSSYKPMSEDEYALLDEDWRAFSRSRGFSEEDITEYDRWLKLSGQTDELRGAINDPWRRRQDFPGTWARRLYLSHVERRILQEREIPTEVRASYKAECAIMDKLKRPMPISITPAAIAVSAAAQETNGAADDIW